MDGDGKGCEMKCDECPDLKDGMCMKAQEGRFSDMEDVCCLLRLQCMLLRDIWDLLCDEETDNWKIN